MEYWLKQAVHWHNRCSYYCVMLKRGRAARQRRKGWNGDAVARHCLERLLWLEPNNARWPRHGLGDNMFMCAEISIEAQLAGQMRRIGEIDMAKLVKKLI